MNKIRVFMAFVVIACFVCSCDRDMQNYDSNRQGTVQFQIETNSAANKIDTRTTGEKNVEDFSLTLKKNDETIGFWERFSEYKEGTLFPFGSYLAVASYGDIAQEGLNKPYYTGESPFTISSSANPVNVNITCALANAKMTVIYTDAFKSYFSAYHATNVVSSLGNTFDIGSDVTDELYLKPGAVDIYATVKKQNATDNVRFEVKKGFELKARQHYKLTLDVEAGSSTLVVTFTEDVEEVTIEFNVSDEELNKLAPYFASNGFEFNQANNIIEGAEIEQAQVILAAQSGIASCILTTNSLSLKSLGWPETIDFVAPSAEALNAMQALGIKVKGFDGKSEMAVIDFTEVIPYIIYNAENPESTFTLTATDKIGRVNMSTSSFIVKTLQSNNLFSLPTSVAFASQSITTIVQTTFPTTKLSFFYWDNNIWNPITASNVVVMGNNSYMYTFNFDFPLMNTQDGFRMKAHFNKIVREGSTIIEEPYLNLNIVSEGAVWATRATFRIAQNTITRAFDMSNVHMECKNGNEWITPTQTVAGDQITVTDLTPGQTYTFRAIYDDGSSVAIPLQSFHNVVSTESSSQLPNSDMNDWDIEHSRDLATTKWDGLSKTTYHAYIPNTRSWGTTNPKTFNHGSGYCINAYTSVVTEDRGNGNKAALIRSIGWNTGSGNGYGGLTGNKCAERSAGKLFLGSYSFDRDSRTDSYNYGIAFTSRPKSIAFEYKYSKFSNDYFKVWAVVENRSENGVKRLAYGEIAAGDNASEYTTATFELTYDPQYKDLKATHFYIVFSSSNKCSDLHSEETNLMESPRIVGVVGGSYWGGSVLYIDNIHLNY